MIWFILVAIYFCYDLVSVYGIRSNIAVNCFFIFVMGLCVGYGMSDNKD